MMASLESNGPPDKQDSDDDLGVELMTIEKNDSQNLENIELNSTDEIVETDDSFEESPKNNKRGVKLGLGDFVFYSVLVGRAALFDMVSVFSAFIGVITGLFGTILFLAVWKKALPALPLSILFATLFFFLSKFFLIHLTNSISQYGVFM